VARVDPSEPHGILSSQHVGELGKLEEAYAEGCRDEEESAIGTREHSPLRVGGDALADLEAVQLLPGTRVESHDPIPPLEVERGARVDRVEDVDAGIEAETPSKSGSTRREVRSRPRISIPGGFPATAISDPSRLTAAGVRKVRRSSE
jgi:hypothetical protein